MARAFFQTPVRDWGGAVAVHRTHESVRIQYDGFTFWSDALGKHLTPQLARGEYSDARGYGANLKHK